MSLSKYKYLFFFLFKIHPTEIQTAVVIWVSFGVISDIISRFAFFIVLMFDYHIHGIKLLLNQSDLSMDSDSKNKNLRFNFIDSLYK